MDPARRAWLEKLISACDRALAELPELESPPLSLISDFRELRARLVAELAGD